MATTQTIDATIFASTHPDIAKRISVSGVLISSVMLLIGILAFGSFSADSKIKSEASGNIRMDVILSADKKFAAVQLFQFVPYTYQPITSVQYFTNEKASAIVAFLSKSKIQ